MSHTCIFVRVFERGIQWFHPLRMSSELMQPHLTVHHWQCLQKDSSNQSCPPISACAHQPRLELSSSWRLRALESDIPPSVALCLSPSSAVSLQTTPPHLTIKPALLTTHQGTTLIIYLVTEASLSLSKYIPPSLLPSMLPRNQQTSTCKNKSPSMADCGEIWQQDGL